MSSETRFPSDCSLDVVGIGNAIVDVLVQTDDSFIAEQGLQKGGMALIDEQQAEALYKASGTGLETSGGSVANTMVGIAQLGGRAGFIGRVRDDQLGSIFSHDIRAVGARFETPAATSGATTARCLIYVTPDAELGDPHHGVGDRSAGGLEARSTGFVESLSLSLIHI